MLTRGDSVLTMLALSLCLNAYPDDAPTSDRSLVGRDYGSMTREQLLRARDEVEEARPGHGGMVLSWLGIAFGTCFLGTGAFFVAPGWVPSFNALGVAMIVVGVGMAAAGITYLAVKSPARARRRLGRELDLIDNLLDNMRASLATPSSNGLSTLAIF